MCFAFSSSWEIEYWLLWNLSLITWFYFDYSYLWYRWYWFMNPCPRLMALYITQNNLTGTLTTSALERKWPITRNSHASTQINKSFNLSSRFLNSVETHSFVLAYLNKLWMIDILTCRKFFRNATLKSARRQ